MSSFEDQSVSDTKLPNIKKMVTEIRVTEIVQTVATHFT